LNRLSSSLCNSGELAGKAATVRGSNAAGEPDGVDGAGPDGRGERGAVVDPGRPDLAFIGYHRAIAVGWRRGRGDTLFCLLNSVTSRGFVEEPMTDFGLEGGQ
jgi:hypothetical protein